MGEYKEDNFAERELQNRQIPFDLYANLFEEDEEVDGIEANQEIISRTIKINSQSKLPLPFLASIRNLNEYFKSQKPKTFDSGFKYQTMDILINTGIAAEHNQIQLQSLYALFYLIEFIDQFYKYFMDNEFYLAIDQFLTGEPCQQMYASLLISYAIIQRDNEYVERLIEIMPPSQIKRVIIKEIETEEGFKRLIITKCRPLITRVLALIFTTVAKNQVSADALQCAHIVFSSGFSYSLNEKYNIPSICSRGIYLLYKSKQLDDTLFGDELPDFVLIASTSNGDIIDTVDILKATFPFIEKNPIEFTCDYDTLMEITHEHMMDEIGVYALRCIKMIIESELENSCLAAFIDSKGIDFLYIFASEEASFNVLNEAMRVVTLVIERTTDPEDLELLLTPEIFELCARSAEIENDEMQNNVVNALDLISLRCTEEEERSQFIELSESIELGEILNDIMDNLNEKMAVRAQALLSKICDDDDDGD